MTGFRSIIELCQYSLSEEDMLRCEETVEDYKSKVMGYCYNAQQIDPGDEFCMAALPPPSPNQRTQNILGDRARTGRLMVIPQLPVDFDELPELLQDDFDEDTYDAILNDEPFPGCEGYSSAGLWRGALRFGYDFMSIGGYDLNVKGENIPNETVGPVSESRNRFGGSLEVSYHWDMGLFMSTGAEYMVSLTSPGGNVHTVDGLLGTGFQIKATESFDFEFSVIAKLGYLFLDGPVYHENLGAFDVANFDAGLAARISFVMHLSDHWRAIVDMEGSRTFTYAVDNGLEITTFFPYSFFTKLGVAVI